MSADAGFIVFFVAVVTLILVADLTWLSVLIVVRVRRRRKIAALKRRGRRVIARVTEVSHESVFNPGEVGRSGIVGFGRHLFRSLWFVEADWTDPQTGVPHRFKSGPHYRRQAKLYTVGELIGVLVDPDDPNRYYVEPAH